MMVEMGGVSYGKMCMDEDDMDEDFVGSDVCICIERYGR